MSRLTIGIMVVLGLTNCGKEDNDNSCRDGGGVLVCPDGSVWEQGKEGVAGKDGREGANGQDGKDGVDGKDGIDGQDGKDGVDGKDSIIELVKPCGDRAGYQEVLLRLSSGELYAVYFDSKNKQTFMVILSPGTYQTTDSYKDMFRVNMDLSVDCLNPE